jgi:hypothetical protein
MLNDNRRSYVANLPVGAIREALQRGEVEAVVNAVDLHNLPNGIVTG